MSSTDERFKNRGGHTRNAAVVKYAGGSSTPSASFQRPHNVAPYAAGQLVAPDPVVPMQFTAMREYATSCLLVKARLRKSGLGLAGAAFVLHLYTDLPVPVNPDGGVFLTDKSSAYIGSFDIFDMRAFSDGAWGVGAPTVDGPICVELAQDQRVLYGLLEVRGGYTPDDGETFEVTLELQQD